MLYTRLDFVRIEFIRRAKIKILPHKQSENPLHLRKIQEFYRSNKAKFYPLMRNLKFHPHHKILKFPQKIKPLICKFKIPPICKASRLIRHATKIKFLNSARSAYLANK